MQEIIKLGNLYKKKHQSGVVYSENGNAPALCAGCHSYGIPFVLIIRKGSIRT